LLRQLWELAPSRIGTQRKKASDLVGRPGLDPGTLGLKVLCSSG
jgi:hypothetical protein